jgi:hypothetical protein
MISTTSFKSIVRASAVVAALTLGTGYLQTANAGCGQYQGVGKMRFELGDQVMSLDAPMFRPEAFTRTSWEASLAPIVGLWHFVYISQGNTALEIPDGAPVDGGNTVWYGDGNESTSSEMRDPATGSICLGIWKRTGEQSYELNHIGLSWDPVGKKAAGPAFIKQFVNLDKSGDKYTGIATITQLDPDGKTVTTVPVPGNPTPVPLIIHARIVAYRVMLDTSKQTPIVPAPPQ